MQAILNVILLLTIVLFLLKLALVETRSDNILKLANRKFAFILSKEEK